jgi:Flp pilus assembly pilin Flp
MKIATAIFHDESGFILSAELTLVATILVLGMVVGLSQIQNAVVSEMNDVGHAIGALNQSYYYSGFHARKWFGWTKSRTVGSAFYDLADACDAWGCQISCDGAYPEGGYWGCGYAGGDWGYSSCAGWATPSGTACAASACSTTVCSPTVCQPVECSPAKDSSSGATCAPLIAP